MILNEPGRISSSLLGLLTSAPPDPQSLCDEDRHWQNKAGKRKFKLKYKQKKSENPEYIIWGTNLCCPCGHESPYLIQVPPHRLCICNLLRPTQLKNNLQERKFFLKQLHTSPLLYDTIYKNLCSLALGVQGQAGPSAPDSIVLAEYLWPCWRTLPPSRNPECFCFAQCATWRQKLAAGEGWRGEETEAEEADLEKKRKILIGFLASTLKGKFQETN